MGYCIYWSCIFAKSISVSRETTCSSFVVVTSSNLNKVRPSWCCSKALFMPLLLDLMLMSPPSFSDTLGQCYYVARHLTAHICIWLSKNKGDISQLKCLFSRLGGGGGAAAVHLLPMQTDNQPPIRTSVINFTASLWYLVIHVQAPFKLLNHSQIRTKASVVAAPQSWGALVQSFFFFLLSGQKQVDAAVTTKGRDWQRKAT